MPEPKGEVKDDVSTLIRSIPQFKIYPLPEVYITKVSAAGNTRERTKKFEDAKAK